LSYESHPVKDNKNGYNFDIRPYSYQERILEELKCEREVHGNFKNLIVAATGTGKTVISAFDFKRFLKENSDHEVKFLFIAHRKEILDQSLSCFRGVLGDNNFGEMMVDGISPSSLNNLFASIQTFNSKELYKKLSADYYDYIVIDEFHHAAAQSYQELLRHFTPKILIGLTATSERMDGKDILQYFNNRISVEIRLLEAINNNLLVPFSYFGISDDTDLSKVTWSRGGYDLNELSNVLTNNKVRTSMIIRSLDKYLNDISCVKGLGFCVSKAHADYMCKAFNEANINSISLNSDSSDEERDSAKSRLIKGEINFIFVVDLYNEGVDIKEINTVLFLRPTDSLTVFLQQLGRGLRLCEGKDSLTVLDYVGQANKKFRYEDNFSAHLSSKSDSVENEVKHDFPNLSKFILLN
jgi:superfamily II DNA or RNA helicase